MTQVEERQQRIRQLESQLRRLRRDDRLWTETDDKVFNLIGKTKERLRKLRAKTPRQVGPYSGLTKAELRQSGTCEPDWF